MELHRDLTGADRALAEEAHMRAMDTDEPWALQMAYLTEAVLVLADRVGWLEQRVRDSGRVGL